MISRKYLSQYLFKSPLMALFMISAISQSGEADDGVAVSVHSVITGIPASLGSVEAIGYWSVLPDRNNGRERLRVALLMIGSSYTNGTTRIDDRYIGALNSAAVGSGAYLSLGDALVRSQELNGLVINEGVVGATSKDRVSCAWYKCLPGGKMPGYVSQFENALRRVAVYDPNDFQTIIGYNANYVVIGVPNDCIHSDAFGIPQLAAVPCTYDDFVASADRIVAIANRAVQLGITPILMLHPRYEDLELSLVQQGLGLYWVIGEYEYRILREVYKTKFETQVPGAIVMDPWDRFTHRGDGIHPNRETVERAAKKIAKVVSKNH